MALNNYSVDNLVVTVNGRVIDDWGQSDPPYSDDPVNQKRTMIQGQGGNAVSLDRLNPGRRVTLNLNPGGSDSSFMQGLFNSNANVAISVQSVGTLESAIGTEGIVENDGTVGRGGSTSITDDQYILMFNSWTASKGGE